MPQRADSDKPGNFGPESKRVDVHAALIAERCARGARQLQPDVPRTNARASTYSIDFRRRTFAWHLNLGALPATHCSDAPAHELSNPYALTRFPAED